MAGSDPVSPILLINNYMKYLKKSIKFQKGIGSGAFLKKQMSEGGEQMTAFRKK